MTRTPSPIGLTAWPPWPTTTGSNTCARDRFNSFWLLISYSVISVE